MKLRTISIAASLLVACASNPSNDLQAARDARTADFKTNVRAQQRLIERQKAERSELAYKQNAERNRASKTTIDALVSDDANVAAAAAKVVSDRRVFVAEMQNRLDTVDARAAGLRARTRLVSNSVQKRVAPIWRSFESARLTAKARLGALPSGEEIEPAKRDVQARMDALDRTLDAIASKVKE